MSTNASSQEIEQLEQEAEQTANYFIDKLEESDKLLQNIEEELEKLGEIDREELEEEEERGASDKEIQMDKTELKDIQEAINDISGAKRELDDAIKPLMNSNFFAIVSGFAADIGASSQPTEEVMEEVDAALRDELGGAPPKEKMVNIGERAADLKEELIDSRQRIKDAAQDLMEIKDIDQSELQSESDERLKREEKQEYEIVIDILNKISQLTNLEATRNDLEEGSTRNTQPLDRSIGTMDLVSVMAEYEIS